ncbi:MAG: galactose oxidase-like domain-containing protein [Candidatus Acidiferrum sp.]
MPQPIYAQRVVVSRALIRVAGIAAITVFLLLAFQLPALSQTNVQGQWRTLSTQAPINPIHLSLMHNGQVLIVSGSGNYPPNTNYMAGVFNPQTDVFTTQPLNWDMFCNGMIVLPDGRPFVISGTLQYDPFEGLTKTSSYNPVTGNFVDLQPMAHGRWYPTATTLGNGQVMVFSGLDENGDTNTTVEIYTVGVGWSTPYQAPWTPPLYPRMHLLPNGTVFYSGSTTTSSIFNPATQVWTVGVATTNYSGTRTYGSSVLLPLTPANNYDPRVMIMGGGNPATNTTEIINLGASNPKWVYGPKMSAARIEMDATILPTGNVLILNGSVNDEDATTASLGADLYNTATNTISSAGSGAYARLYHSGSLLLPDATVLVVGGNPERGTYQPAMEIYTPAYLFNSSGGLATRPTITSVTPGVVGYGTSFQIQTPDAASITSAVLIRAGSPTHAFDMDQRFVGLSFTAGSGVLTATAPPNGNIAPPGYYLLFLLNSSGVPSVAQFVQLSLNPTDQPPTGTIATPTSNVTILPGQTVSFSGSGTSPSGSIAAYSWVFPGGSPASSTVANPGTVTFSTPGTYTASLTVTDNLGVTDPNPPTRIITVSPDFSLSPTPTVQNIVPGSNTTVDVIVTPSGQFSGTVNLSISGLPSGVTASFNPTSISGSGTSVLTLTASASTAVGSSTVTVTGTSGSETHTTTFTLNVSTSTPTANAINIDFVGLGTPMGSTEVAGVVPMSNWNDATGASSSSPLALGDETGAATQATVTWTADDVWDQPITDAPGNVRMMEGYLDNGNQDTTTVTVSGLPSNASGFTVYVYAQGGSNGSTNTGIYQISGAGITTTSATLTYNSNFNGTFTQATESNPIGNYVVFTIPNVPSFKLSAIPSTATDGYERAPVNGIQIVPIAAPNPNFSVSATPSTTTVGLSSTTTYTVTVGALAGFTSAVTLSASGLPAGATASFSPASITTSGTSTMTVTTASGTPTGSSTVTITGTSGSLTNSTSVTLVVSGPDFTVSATPSSFSVDPGGTATYTVTVGALYGYTGQVSFSVSGLPAGASASFSPVVITQSGTSTLTVTTSTTTPGGSPALTITGTGTEELAHNANVTLNVTAPNFTLAVSPSTTSIIAGGTATYTVTVGAQNGFTGTVALAATGLPAGASASFSPPSITSSGTSTLTVTTVASTPTGSSTLAITGTSGSLTQSANAILGVTSSSSTLVISIDFVGLGNPMGSTEVAGVVPKSNWNLAEGAINTSGLPLANENGAVTSAIVTWTADDVWDEPLKDAPGNVRMMEGYLDNGNQDTTVVNVSGLPPDPNGYSVYVYADGGITSGTDTGIYQISGTGITASSVSLTYGSVFNGTFAQATSISPDGNYVILTIPSVSAFTLSAIPSAATSGYKRAPITGIQIVPLGPPNPDFAISATPASETVNAGNSTTYTVSIAPLNGFTGTVNLTASGLPAGATAIFSPSSVSGSGTSTLTVSTTTGSAASSSTISATGTSGSLVHSATATLNVVAPDFSVAVSPGTVSVAPGGTATYTVTVAPLNGFTGTVNLSATDLPTGASPTFLPASITTSGTSTLTIITGSTTGSSTLSITGTSGSLTHSTTAILDVTTAGSSSGVISIDFVGTDVPMASTEVAGVVAESNWNDATGASSSNPLALVNASGNSTGATVSWTSDDVWEESITDAPGNVRMMKGYLDNGNEDTSTLTVSGLPSDPNGYKIYVYADGAISSGSDTGIYQVSGTGITTSSVTLTYKANFAGTFTQATASSPVGNYLILTIPNVSGFTLSAIPSSSTSGYNRAALNGVQIVPQ